MKNIYCDKGCDKDFEIDLKTISIRDVEKNYFNCPHCNVEYVAFYTNDLIRRLQEELFKLVQTKKRTKKIHLRIIKLKKKIKYQMDLLKQEVERGGFNEENKMSSL